MDYEPVTDLPILYLSDHGKKVCAACLNSESSGIRIMLPHDLVIVDYMCDPRFEQKCDFCKPG